MHPDIETPLMVNLDSLTISNQFETSSNLLDPHVPDYRNFTLSNTDSIVGKVGSTPIRIDSSRPFIYLPGWACDSIARILDLNYSGKEGDPETWYYYVTPNGFSAFAAANMSMNFRINNIGDNKGNSPIMIKLPYWALVQNLTYPLGEGQQYIPIRRASDPAQYVLGRTFLQETYLTADYERKTFSLHQAAFPYPATEDLVVLKAPFRITKEVIGAIAGGTTALIILLLTALFFLRRIKLRRRREEAEAEEEAARIKGLELEISLPISPNSPSSVDKKIIEIDSETVHEIGGMPGESLQEIGVPVTPIHGELPDESTLSSYRGFFKQEASERQGDYPITSKERVR
jgi:hypothetical protein